MVTGGGGTMWPPSGFGGSFPKIYYAGTVSDADMRTWKSRGTNTATYPGNVYAMAVCLELAVTP